MKKKQKSCEKRPCLWLLFRKNSTFASTMKKTVLLLWLMSIATWLAAQDTDPHSIRMGDIPLEGPIDSVMPHIKAAGYTEWGRSDDGEDYYYRGKFYGIRAKLLVSTDTLTRMVTSAYITVGPYRTESMLKRNTQYFLLKLQQEYGTFQQRDGAWYYMDDYGSVRFSIVSNDSGSKDIRVFYYPGTPYYKDAFSMGLHGSVQEVVTENAVAEDQFLHFGRNGQIEDPDMTDRQYDRYGYLRQARMTEKEGYSDVSYEYDGQYRLVRRTLTNAEAGITYVNEYTWSDENEISSERQKVFDKQKECIMTISMQNSYVTRDDNGNWTTNSLTLTYWEKGEQSQQVNVLQKRTLAYWE